MSETTTTPRKPAQVVLDYADPWDTVNRIKVECPPCGIEWAWSPDVKGDGNYDRLQGYANVHNWEVHGNDE